MFGACKDQHTPGRHLLQLGEQAAWPLTPRALDKARARRSWQGRSNRSAPSPDPAKYCPPASEFHQASLPRRKASVAAWAVDSECAGCRAKSPCHTYGRLRQGRALLHSKGRCCGHPYGPASVLDKRRRSRPHDATPRLVAPWQHRRI